MRSAVLLVLLLIIASSCTRGGHTSRPTDTRLMAPWDGLSSHIPQDTIGRIFFAVGGATNSRTKEFRSDPAYQPFWVFLVRGQHTLRGDTGRVYVIGTQSAVGMEILEILTSEAPWRNEPEHRCYFANHLVFTGELDGRKWEFSRTYPDPTIDRIVRSFRRALDKVPYGESR